MSKSQAQRIEEFVDEEFETPATTDEAYNFGKVTAIGRHGRMSREQFFRHDTHPRPYGTHGLWVAYRKGYDEGRIIRRKADETAALTGGR